ncbi:NADH dehydrogenase 1 alpha subcomplex subunit 12 ndufa12/DAP13 [Cichlidogyrus casuarinus]|uniref:NADH dehydrogenase [ubiquinone] 1 alpha subcomplex subunit 12 n=1 Tax=Cichlidogyrus casuarinus TaxID=1844966 RepID=A0ABD2QF50_9PLAT
MLSQGRNRWVVYGKIGWDYEGSCVPPEWHRWLHYIGDHIPSSADESSKKQWYLEHKMNSTLDLDKKYTPYTTTKPKIQEWDPSSVKK